MADAGGGVLQGLGHEADAAHAGEEEDAVAKVLALHEEIDGEDDDDAEGSDGAKEAHEEFGGGLELGAVGIDDADGLGLGGGCAGLAVRRCRCSEVSADVPTAAEGFFEGLLGGGVDGGHFCWMLRR